MKNNSSFLLQVQYWTQSVPTSTGSIYQLSQVFSTYGYPPAAGPSLLNNTQVTGSGNRFVYGRPSRDRATNALVCPDSFCFFTIIFVIIIDDCSGIQFNFLFMTE